MIGALIRASVRGRFFVLLAALALTVAGRDDSLSRRRVLALAEGAGLPPRAADRAVDEILTATADLRDLPADALPLAPHVLRDLRRVLGKRHDALTSG